MEIVYIFPRIFPTSKSNWVTVDTIIASSLFSVFCFLFSVPSSQFHFRFIVLPHWVAVRSSYQFAFWGRTLMESNEMTLIAEGHCTRFHISTPAALSPRRRSTRRIFACICSWISGNICVSYCICICCSGCIWIWVVVVVRCSWLACYNSDAFMLSIRVHFASAERARAIRSEAVCCFNADWQITAISAWN